MDTKTLRVAALMARGKSDLARGDVSRDYEINGRATRIAVSNALMQLAVDFEVMAAKLEQREHEGAD